MILQKITDIKETTKEHTSLISYQPTGMDNNGKEVTRRGKARKRYKKKVLGDKEKGSDQSVQVGSGLIRKGSWEYADERGNENEKTERHKETVRGQEGDPIEQKSGKDEIGEICMICRRSVGASSGSLFEHLNSEHFKPEWGTFSIETYRKLHETTDIQLDIRNLEDPFKVMGAESN